jgi:hypothetical protein
MVLEEGVFLCNGCARAYLGLGAGRLWAKRVVITLGGLPLALVLLALGRLILALVVVGLTVAALRQNAKQLRYLRDREYLRDPQTVRLLTGLAIRLRMADILRDLVLSERQTIFLSEAAYKAQLQLRQI